MFDILQQPLSWAAAHPVVSGVFLTPLLLVIIFTIYHGWPKPLPGIPHNKNLGFWGDVPSLISHVNKTGGEFFTWHNKQSLDLQEALIQVFISPFHSRPSLLLADTREAQDILLRRTDEFDRAEPAKDFVRGLIPKGQITLSTNDEWKAHRALTKDLMTPAFLHSVSAPAIHTRAVDLVNLWRAKVRLAKGRPFDAEHDIHYCALDAIFDAAFGTEDSQEILRAELNDLEKLEEKACVVAENGSMTFKTSIAPELAHAIMLLDESTEYALQSMMPKLAWKVLTYVPWWARAWNMKEDLLKRSIEKSRNRIERKTTQEYEQRCALDNMVARELNLAKKAGRSPDFDSRAFYDELFGYIVGGHDTTSTSTQWAVKFLAENPSAQSKFREALHSSVPAAVAEKRNPTAEEIVNAKDPYIDAILEEILRHSQTLPGTTRVATRDATILGHHVPKGTEVWMLGSGPGYFSPAFKVDESLRSPSSRQALADGRTYGSWNEKDMSAFRPERWLVEEAGKVSFNKMAGLHLTFGLGPRGCFGRRLAYVKLRLFVCLLVWNFVFEPIDGELASRAFVDKLTRVPTKCFVKLSPAN